MNAVRSNSLNLKYQRFKPSDCIDILIKKLEFMEKTCLLNDKRQKRLNGSGPISLRLHLT